MGILSVIYKNYNKPRKKKFTEDQKKILRPLAESIAILDGNAFWGLTRNENNEDTWYEQYLPEAWVIYKSNPGIVHGTSWGQMLKHENPTVQEAYENWIMLKILSKTS